MIKESERIGRNRIRVGGKERKTCRKKKERERIGNCIKIAVVFIRREIKFKVRE